MKTAEDPCEPYCQVLEHKWFVSEREKKDVGLRRAVDDYKALRLKEAGTHAAVASPATAAQGTR